MSLNPPLTKHEVVETLTAVLGEIEDRDVRVGSMGMLAALVASGDALYDELESMKRKFSPGMLGDMADVKGLMTQRDAAEAQVARVRTAITDRIADLSTYRLARNTYVPAIIAELERLLKVIEGGA